MDRVKTIALTARYNFSKWLSNPRYLAILLLIVGFLINVYGPIRTFTNITKISATPFSFPYLMSDWYINMIIFFGVIFILCDAPFIDPQQPYVMIRTGKTAWANGQILYIFLTSAVYFLAITLLTILLLMPQVTFVNEWGKIWGTLAQTTAGEQFGVQLNISYLIMLHYSPLEALFYSLTISILAAFLLGLLMFILNLVTSHHYVGIIAAFAIDFLPAFSRNRVPALQYLSPTSWANLTAIDMDGTTMLPSFLYVYLFLFICISIMIFYINFTVKRIDYNVQPVI